MFCPNCGSEERQVSQFCRACGTDLRVVRVSMEKPDAITASAASARDEIGRAIADRIRELETGDDLKRVAEDVLPQIEKFLESPQQRRLRGIRTGVVTSA
ncbi:MAG TPA: zinc ribbon domain-containing protein, partial [Blastocatellia bacterium]|nr:zinc ribbon domain-containing protein [Blastocatellia bacterium]